MIFSAPLIKAGKMELRKCQKFQTSNKHDLLGVYRIWRELRLAYDTGMNFGNQISGDCCSNETETFIPSLTSSTEQPITLLIMRGPSSRSIQATT